MRFSTFSLLNYGHFQNHELTFPIKNEGDFHLIYGPNEAGKSTVLQALDGFLFTMPARGGWFPHRTTKNAVELVATGETYDGPFSLTRRKTQKDLIFDGEKELALPERPLFLRQANANNFRQIYGLNHEALRDGADLLGKDDTLGPSLVGAIIGVEKLSQALKNLETQAHEFIKKSWTASLKLPGLQKEYADLKKKIEQEQADPVLRKNLLKERQIAVDHHNACEKNQNRYREQLDRLGRLREIRPVAEEKRALQQQLEALTLPKTSVADAQELAELLQQREESQKQLKSDRETLQRYRIQLAERQPNQAVLDQAGAIDALSEQNIRLKQTSDDLATAQKRLLELDHLLGLRSSEPSQWDDFSRSDLKILQQFATTGDQLRLEKRVLSEQKDELDHRKVDLTTRAAELPDEQAVGAAEKAYEQFQQLRQAMAAEATAAEEAATSRATAQRSRDGLGYGEADIPARHLLPSAATVEEFRVSFDENERSLKQNSEQQEGLDRQVVTIKSELNLLQQKSALYTEPDLRKAREDRDQLLVEENWKQLPSAIYQADTIVDALRQHTEVLAKAAELQNRIRELEQEQNRSLGQAETIKQARRSIEAQWSSATAALPPGLFAKPSQVATWSAAFDEWQQAQNDWERAKEALNAARNVVEGLKAEIQGADDQGDDLSEFEVSLKAQATKLAKQKTLAESAKADLQKVEETLAGLQRKLSKADEELDQHNTDLKAFLDRKGVVFSEIFTANEIPSIEEAVQRQELTTERRQLRIQVASMEEKQDAFSKELAALAKQLDCSASLTTLRDQLEAERKRKTTAETLTEQVQDLEHFVAQRETNLTPIVTQIKEITDRYDRDEVELQRLFAKEEGFRTREAETDRQLAQAAAGFPGDLMAELSDPQWLKWETEFERLEIEEETGKEAWSDSVKALDRAEVALKEFDQIDSETTRARQELEMVTEELVEAAQEALTLHEALDFLSQEQARICREHAEPVLERTSYYFRVLTDRSYLGADTVYHENGPRLQVLRPSTTGESEPEPVALAELSEGTRDQLYLALRFAALENDLRRQTCPLPLILDDILMTFDDQRTIAAFQALAELSKKVQVLIFTHHRHLLDLAEQTSLPIQTQTLHTQSKD